MTYRFLSTASFALLMAWSLSTSAQGPSRAEAALEKVWGNMLTAPEWRTANPDFDGGKSSPSHYSLSYQWGDHRSHILGKLEGIYPSDEGEKRALYWNFVITYNPVHDEVTATQIGWNGSIGVGPATILADGQLQIDQVFYGVDGTMKMTRHLESLSEDGETLSADSWKFNETGEWVVDQEWDWSAYDPAEVAGD